MQDKDSKEYMGTEILIYIVDAIKQHLDQAVKYRLERKHMFTEKDIDPQFDLNRIEKSVSYREEAEKANQLVDKYRNCCDKYGHNLLHIALIRSCETALYLLEKGYSPVEETNYGVKPIQLVPFLKQDFLVKNILATKKISNTDLFYKTPAVNLKSVIKILDRNKKRDKFEEEIVKTIMPLALNSAYLNGIVYKNYDFVDYCINRAKDIAKKNYPDDLDKQKICYKQYVNSKRAYFGDNGMIIAIKNRDPKMVELLVNADVSVTEKDKDGKCAYNMIAEPNYFDADIADILHDAVKDEMEQRYNNHKDDE